MSRAPNRIFLERRSYRRRRLMDAARLLPIVGLLLFLVPLLWAPDRVDRASTASTTIYVFAVWFVLIAGAVLLTWALSGPAETGDGARDEDPVE